MKSDRPSTTDWNTSYLEGLRGAEVARQHAKALKSRAEKRRYRAALLAQMHALPKLGNGPDYRKWTPLTPQEAGVKTASKVNARALEGMLGGVLGGGVAGAGRAVFWEPKEPREWADQYGNIYDRPLTVEEKKARRQAVSRAMLAGALGGSGASLGASALVGKRIAKVEREAAQEAVQDFLDPFRKLIANYKSELDNVSRWNPDNQVAQHMKKRVATAEKLLAEQEKVTDKLVDKTMGRRAQLPFRGALHPADSGSVDWRELSAAHQVDKHFDGLAKEVGYPPIFSQPPRTTVDAATAEDLATRVFDRLVERAMTKTSAEAFWNELEKVAAYTIFSPGHGGGFSRGLLDRFQQAGAVRPPPPPMLSTGYGVRRSSAATMMQYNTGQLQHGAVTRNLAQVDPPATLPAPPASTAPAGLPAVVAPATPAAMTPPPLNKTAKQHDPSKFAGLPVLPLSREDRGTLNRRLQEAGLSPGSVGLKKTEKGYAVHTHRARSDWYPSVAAIPLARLKFIESTG